MRPARLALVLAAAAAVASGLPAQGHPVHLPKVIAGTFAQPVLRAASEPTDTSARARYSYQIPRSTRDRKDLVEGWQVHVVYLLGSDSTDEALDTKGVIEMSMRAQNQWFKGQTGQSWIYDTFNFTANGRRRNALDVTFVRMEQPISSIGGVGDVESALRAAGLGAAQKRYLVYVPARTGGICGEAFYPLISNDPEVDGQYSAVYLDADPGCHSRDFATSLSSPGWAEAIILQEMIHNDGVVPISSPHSCFTPLYGHVCTAELGLVSPTLDPESRDVMFPFVTGSLASKKVDPGNDDYYKVRLGFALRDLEDSPYLTR